MSIFLVVKLPRAGRKGKTLLQKTITKLGRERVSACVAIGQGMKEAESQSAESDLELKMGPF